MKKINSILWGVALIALGVILSLNAFNITSINIFFDGWWTLFIIVPCAIGLITNHEKCGNIIGICIGVFLLLCCRGIWSFGMFWKLLVPAIIVIIGIKMIFGNIIGGRKGEEVYKTMKNNGTEFENATATFSSAALDFSGEVFHGAEMNAVFGGAKCDLRNAVIENDCVINATAVFGGIDIFVPDNINVKINSTSIFGGVSKKNPRKNEADRPTLYINATCLFGGVDIK